MPRKETAKAVLEDPLFKTAISWAKGYAKALEEEELTPALLLAGLLKAYEKVAASASKTDRKWEKALEDALAATGWQPPDKLEPIEKETLPLSHSLKRIIKENSEDFSELIQSLITEVSNSAKISIPSFAIIIEYASAIAASQSKDFVDQDTFAAAAYIACIDGKLDTDFSLASYLIANNKACLSLLEHLDLTNYNFTQKANLVLPLSNAIRRAISEKGTEADRLRSAVSLGLDTGVKINKKVGVAYHEAGHAIVSAVLRPSLTITKVTVVPDASEGYDGATFYDGSSVYKNERGTRDWLIAKLCTSLAGVVSQKIKFGLGQIDDGASSDIETATEVAWDSITNKGLDPEFGPISLSALSKVADTDHGWLFDLAQRRTQEVLKESATRAEKILLTNWEHVEMVVLQLLERETIFDAGFLAAIQTKTLKDLPSVRRAASKPEKRQIRFPVRGGVIETSEGPVRYRIGDGIISGIDGQTWPADRSYLEKAYKPIPPVLMGEDGSYTKISRDVLVIELSESSRVDLPMGMGTLTGKSGDFLVDYGQGDVSVIVRERFLSSYDFCD